MFPFFPSIFENKKCFKNLKKNLKSKNTKKETLVRVKVLFVFLLLHGVEAQHNHVQDTMKKKELFLI